MVSDGNFDGSLINGASSRWSVVDILPLNGVGPHSFKNSGDLGVVTPDGGRYFFGGSSTTIGQQITTIQAGVTYHARVSFRAVNASIPAPPVRIFFSNALQNFTRTVPNFASKSFSATTATSLWRFLSIEFTATLAQARQPLWVNLESFDATNTRSVAWDQVTTWAAYGDLVNGDFESTLSSSWTIAGCSGCVVGLNSGSLGVATADGGRYASILQGGVMSQRITPVTVVGVTYAVRCAARSVRGSALSALGEIALTDGVSNFGTVSIVPGRSFARYEARYVATSAHQLRIQLKAVFGELAFDLCEFYTAAGQLQFGVLDGSASVSVSALGWTRVTLGPGTSSRMQASGAVSVSTLDGGNWLRASAVLLHRQLTGIAPARTYTARVFAAMAGSVPTSASLYFTASPQRSDLSVARIGVVASRLLTIPGRWIALEATVTLTTAGPLHLNLECNNRTAGAFVGLDMVSVTSALVNGNFEGSGVWTSANIQPLGDSGPNVAVSGGSGGIITPDGGRWVNNGLSLALNNRLPTSVLPLHPDRLVRLRARSLSITLLGTPATAKLALLANVQNTQATTPEVASISFSPATGPWLTYELFFRPTTLISSAVVVLQNNGTVPTGWDAVEFDVCDDL
jgi:hypothetical protein